MPENAPPGQLPRHIEAILGEDIVDFAKPGDRVRIYGVFKAVSGGGGGASGSLSGVFRSAAPPSAAAAAARLSHRRATLRV